MVITRKRMDEAVETLSEIDLVKGRSLWVDAYYRFRSNKAAVISVFILSFMAFMAYFGTSIIDALGFKVWNYEEIDWDLLGSVEELGQPSFTNGHYFGVDSEARDLFARTMQGTQISLMVGFVGAIVAVTIGLFWGAVAGYVGGRIDNLMMRIVDILMSIPYMFIIIITMAVLGKSITLLFVVIGAFGWMDMARIVRGQTLALKNKEFVEAARATGVSNRKIVIRHIVPNLIGITVIYTSILVPGLILSESFISFLGLGIQEPLTSWGALINAGTQTMQYGVPWQLAFPLSFFIVGLYCLTFIGDGLRDALDPKN